MILLVALACRAPPSPLPVVPLERDGYVYTIDVAQLALAAARRGDADRYVALHPALVRVIHDDPTDPYTRGMVDWRRGTTPDWRPDASGTTEAMRVAEALWTGAAAFDRPDDRALALRVIDGWARHARVDNGVWMVANYYDFQTKSFARNSFLIDYDPDFLAQVARETDDAHLRTLAAQSYAVVEAARTPVGLLYDVLQPEMATLTDPSLVVFSPNDVVQLHNAAAVAEQVMVGRPNLARDVLRFAATRPGPLAAAYRGQDGAPALEGRPATVATWAALCRLAHGVGTSDERRWACDALPTTASDAWTMSEILLVPGERHP